MNDMGYFALSMASTGMLLYTDKWPFLMAGLFFLFAGFAEIFR